MKYVVLLCDGMADLPVKELKGLTPMEKAFKPNMDKLAKQSLLGMVKTVPNGLKPGSDVANLTVLGYDAKTCYSGRSPLEAANLGIDLTENQIALRCNLVTLSKAEEFEDRIMLDYCGDDISTQEAKVLIEALEEEFGNNNRHFYSGVQYRHCLVVEDSEINLNLTPPHDISGKEIGDYLSKNEAAKQFIQLTKQSVDFLENHPINISRKANGKQPANAAWFWGEGKRPNLENFYDKYKIKGSVVSAVDLIKGIARLSQMNVATVEGATGYIDTNFDGKVNAAIDELKGGQDFVFIHLEAPDECGHRGEVDNKVLSIELIDQKVLAPLLEHLEHSGDFRILIMPDHPTPLSTKTHSADAVPFLIYDSRSKLSGDIFTEKNAEKSGLYLEDGMNILPMLFETFNLKEILK